MNVFSYIISLGASVMMPILFTIIGVCIGMKFGKALKSGLYVGVGFVGLGIVTSLLTTNFSDPLTAISQIYHLQLNVFDMGWPAAAAVAYNTAVGALIIPICLGINFLMLITKTMRPVPHNLFAPKIENSVEDLKDLVYSKFHRLYGDNPPEVFTKRVETELHDIISCHYDVIYMSAQKLVQHSLENGYLVGSRGSVGSSIVAYMSGITEVNSFQPHYRCPNPAARPQKTPGWKKPPASPAPHGKTQTDWFPMLPGYPPG